MLKIVLNKTQASGENDSLLFTFSSEQGVRDRDLVKDTIVQALNHLRNEAGTPSQPNGGSASNRPLTRATREELQLRVSVLKKNQQLLRLHQELVGGGLISDDDFWQLNQV